MTDQDQYPGAQYRPLASGEPSAMAKHDLVICHTMVGYLDGTDSYFQDEGWTGTESHFGVGGQFDKPGQDGLVYQWVLCDRRADANLDANNRAISIETSDGARSPVPAWTAAQVESIAGILAWCHDRYGVPLELIPDSKPDRRGVGYHRQGIDDWRVDGGEYWSSSRGKVCPADARIGQMQQVINRARELVGQPVQPPTEPPPSSGTSTFTLTFDGGGSMTLRMIKPANPDMKGTDVRSWQRLLADRGYSPGSIDGYYGDKSATACKNFQKAKGLGADGIIGPKTAERLLEG